MTAIAPLHLLRRISVLILSGALVLSGLAGAGRFEPRGPARVLLAGLSITLCDDGRSRPPHAHDCGLCCLAPQLAAPPPPNLPTRLVARLVDEARPAAAEAPDERDPAIAWARAPPIA